MDQIRCSRIEQGMKPARSMETVRETVMKTMLLTSAFIAFAVPVLAADAVYAPPEAPLPVENPTAVPFTWSGPYLGVQGGGSWLSGDFTLGGVRSQESFDGGVLGAFAGFNHQFDNNVVAGIEGDLSYNWNESDVQGLGNAGTDLNGAVRARLGFAIDRALIYGAAGWTAASGYTDIPGVTKDSKTMNGYTLGAGVDYAITDHMFGRLEYRFNDYGKQDIGPSTFDMKENRVTVGVGVKF